MEFFSSRLFAPLVGFNLFFHIFLFSFCLFIYLWLDICRKFFFFRCCLFPFVPILGSTLVWVLYWHAYICAEWFVEDADALKLRFRGASAFFLSSVRDTILKQSVFSNTDVSLCVRRWELFIRVVYLCECDLSPLHADQRLTAAARSCSHVRAQRAFTKK